MAAFQGYGVAAPNGIFVYSTENFVNGHATGGEDAPPHDDPIPSGVTATRFEIVEAADPDMTRTALEITENGR